MPGEERGGISVLVVDDHTLFAQALSGIIGDQPGYRVAGLAVTGSQAVSLATEKQPRVVLLDYHLPGVTAEELLPTIRRVSPQSRIIILTSDSSAAARRSAEQAGCDGFLTKDIAIDGVMDAMTAVLRTPRTGATIEEIAAPARPARPSIEAEPLIRLPEVGSFARAAAFVRRLERQPGVATA
ncbi:MAG: response regulator transcription factor, partial [Chloroflexi bacterium]|nr:response regulator transcription factor [Chloroflexota bacterium]